MDINTNIITEYNNKDIKDFPRLLETCCYKIFFIHNKVLNQYYMNGAISNINSISNWVLSSTNINNKVNPVLKGPYGINLFFLNNNLCNIDIGHNLELSWFSYNAEIQTILTEIIELIIKVLNGRNYIFIPDAYFGSSKRIDVYIKYSSIVEIEKFLLTNDVYPKSRSEIRRLMNDEELEDSKPDVVGYDTNGYLVKSLEK
ncbi:MAG: hypothetical protein AB8B80_13130 [Marinicellaceae bacterium]